MSPELLLKAASAQRRKLRDEEYLKTITAFDYIRKLKRVEDFDEYAEQIVNKINSGEINRDIPNDENPALMAAAAQSGAEVPEPSAEETAEPIIPVSVKDRKIEMRKAPAEVKFVKHPNPVVNRTSDFDNFMEGEYVVVYISTIDGGLAAVYLDADSKQNAADRAIRKLWDVKEVVSVGLKRNYNPASVVGKPSRAVIDPADYGTGSQLANACATIVTGGEFNNMTELVADIKDDATTEKSASSDEYYEGVDIDGEEWGGRKSSVRMICESENYDWAAKKSDPEDFEVEIVTDINKNGQDGVIRAKVTEALMRKVLAHGIVHIVFIKSDGSERQAFATTNEEVLKENDAVPAQKEDGVSRRSYGNGQVRFYDMTIKKWRSFLMKRLTMVYDESY